MGNISQMEMFISYGISGILFVVFILQLIVYRGTKLSYKTLQNKLDEEQRRYAILENKINQLYNEQTNLVVAKELAIEKLNTQTDANNQLQQRILQLIQENKQLELKRNSLQDELSILIADKAALIQINKAHHELINKQDAILTQVKNQLSEQFSNISKQTLNTLFERSQVELANSQTNLTAQVKTLMDHYNKINDEKEKNINNLTQPIKQQLDVLNVELVKINHSSKSLDEDTKKLISALKGDSKIRGDFGEMQLRNLVENAGLTDYCDFTTQTTTIDDNRPDMILRMPHKHALVIDSKNLTRWANVAMKIPTHISPSTAGCPILVIIPENAANIKMMTSHNNTSALLNPESIGNEFAFANVVIKNKNTPMINFCITVFCSILNIRTWRIIQ